jgi:hypothetical protein
MNRATRVLLSICVLVVSTTAVVTAQVGGAEHCQHTLRMMNSALNELYNESLGALSRESLEAEYGKETVDAFVESAVAKVTLLPDGTYRAQALKGGEVVSVKLGKQRLEPGAELGYDGDWLIREGEFEAPEKARTLSLGLRAGSNAARVSCHRKYGEGEAPVTFYVGALDGLFCIGFDDFEAATSDALALADSGVSPASPSGAAQRK